MLYYFSHNHIFFFIDFFFFFFFSSRRRHTRSLCDWSSDVCSSDLTSCEIRANRLVSCAPAYPRSFSRSWSQLSARNGTDYYKWLRPLCDGFGQRRDRKSTRLNSSHTVISYAVFCLKKKKYGSVRTL